MGADSSTVLLRLLWAAGQERRQHRGPLLYFAEDHTSMGADVTATAHFSIGDLVQHKLFDYRGVVIDVDPRLMLSDEWYDTVARSRPPKDQPWYRVLVHNAIHETYVAERNLEADTSGEPVRHPLIDAFFHNFTDGHYLTAGPIN